METNLVKKGLQSIYGGLQMLSDNKTENLSALAEISIILGSPTVIERYQLSEDINQFLSTLHFLLKDLDKESVSLVTKWIRLKEENENARIDYEKKYEETLVRLVAVQEELISIKSMSEN